MQSEEGATVNREANPMLINRKIVCGLLILILVATSSCKERGLSVEECNTIRKNELRFMDALLGKNSSDPRLANDAPDKAVAQCISGELYSRKDYECVISATTSAAMSLCMAQAHEKSGQ